jgi:hypothetical protein
MPTIRIPQEQWGKVWRALVAAGPVARMTQEPVYQVREEQSACYGVTSCPSGW